MTNPRTGERIRESCKTRDKKLAKQIFAQFSATLLLDLPTFQKLQPRILQPQAPAPIKEEWTWDAAATRWLKETSYKRDHRGDKQKIAWLKPHLSGARLSDTTVGRLRNILETKASESSYVTANRTRGLIRAILNRAATEWGWIEKVPYLKPYKVKSKRIRFLTRDEAQRLLKELAPHLADMMVFTLCTGLRASNVARLKWQQVDLERGHVWIYGDEAKAGKDIGVPLNPTAVEVLKRQVGKHKVFVFVYRGNPVTRQNNHAWRKALARAGIPNFRWHDLRHTWASWHAQAGTPLHVLQELGGWHSYEMVQRYAHLGFVSSAFQAFLAKPHILSLEFPPYAQPYLAKAVW